MVAISQPEVDSGLNDDEYRSNGCGPELCYTDVTLKGIAQDPEDGALDGPSLIWTTDRIDVQDSFLDIGTSTTARLYWKPDCSGEPTDGSWHEITLTGTDSIGNTGSAVRRIFIWGDCVY